MPAVTLAQPSGQSSVHTARRVAKTDTQLSGAPRLTLAWTPYGSHDSGQIFTHTPVVVSRLIVSGLRLPLRGRSRVLAGSAWHKPWQALPHPDPSAQSRTGRAQNVGSSFPQVGIEAPLSRPAAMA